MKKFYFSLMFLVLSLATVHAATHTLKVTVPDQTKVCYAAGPFNSWSPKATPMTLLTESPRVYTLDIEVEEADLATLEFKFCAGPDWKYEMSTPKDNFKYSESGLEVEVTAFTLYYDPAAVVDVKVDVLVPAQVVECYIAGAFNEWSSNATQMTFVSDDAEGKIYTVIVKDLPETMEFKFLAGPGWPYEQASAKNYNYVADGGADNAISVICAEFKAYYDPQKVGDITVNATVPAGTQELYLVGSFNNWSQETGIQATKNADGSFTAVITQQQDVEFKAYCGRGWNYEECKLDGTNVDNRKASFETMPVVNIEVVKWKDQPSGVALIDPDRFAIYTMDRTVVIEGQIGRAELFDLYGHLIQRVDNASSLISATLNSGIYLLRVDGQSQKVLIP